MLFLLLDIFAYRHFIHPNSTYIILFRPKVPISELVSQVGVFIKNHQGIPFPLRYLIDYDTLSFGGMLTIIGT